MLPSCGWNQFNCTVGIAPMLSRSMWRASSRARLNFGSLVIAEHTSVCPIFASI
jgi:hypothetical protein